MSDSFEGNRTKRLFLSLWGASYDLVVPESKDPYAVLDDLMVVVEALCPRWPERGAFRTGNVFKL